MKNDPVQPDAVARMRTYRSTPPGFDPHTASHRLLERHGLPRRPDAEKEPELARLWKRLFTRPIAYVEAELAIDAARIGRAPWSAPDLTYGPSGWAGVVRTMTPPPIHPTTMARISGDAQVFGDYTEAATWVFAQWVVPDVLEVHPADQDLNVGFWVGLDGWGTDQLLQAGISANLDTSGLFDWGSDLSFYAWHEWWTSALDPLDYPVRVENFPVSAGDTIAVLVCAPAPDFGFASFVNMTRGIGTSIGHPARAGITSSGLSAEWIVEAPTASPGLPAFHPLTFTSCVAGSASGGFFHLQPGAHVTEITEPSPLVWGPGPAITRTYVASPTIAIVEWLGFGESF
jgi:hypothetical protein